MARYIKIFKKVAWYFLYGIIVLLLIFLPMDIWGLMQKSQTDSETVEQAIARLIAVHEADEASHLGVGESLQSHKASEIIDHLASSIVADKILYGEITPDKFLFYNSRFVYTAFDSLDGWTQYVSGTGAVAFKLGSVRLLTGATSSSVAQIYASSFVITDPDFSKNPYFMTRVILTATTAQTAYLFMGDNGVDVPGGFGFKIVNGTLYALWTTNDDYTPVENTQEITGVTLTNGHTYKAKFNSGVSIEFFVDDVLKYTATINLPVTPETGYKFQYRITNSASASKSLIADFLLMNQDL